VDISMKAFSEKFWTRVFDNAIALLQGAQVVAENISLVIVSGFAVVSVVRLDMNVWIERGLLAAALVIAVRGLIEILKDLLAIAAARAKVDASRRGNYSVQRPRA
jgi:hypothetical protein